MSSPANAMMTPSGASGAQSVGARPQTIRPGATMKVSDGNRRQASSPNDGPQRRSNLPRAWSQNVNPLTQKPTFSHPNGSVSHRKPSAAADPSASKESNTPDLHANDRLVFLMTAFIGLNAVVTTTKGDKFSGIFSGSMLERNQSSLILKMVQPYEAQQSPNGNATPFIGSPPEHAMKFEISDIADFSVADVMASAASRKDTSHGTVEFRTDADIAGNFTIREKPLQPWQPSGETNVDLSLESADTGGHWDQFEANERLFGATTNYNEEIYTTKIDRNDPSYKHKAAQAAKIAREIESSDTENVHVREERGLAVGNDYDEEEKYSGVKRDDAQFPPLQSGQRHKYTPPQRRAPTGAPTVPGAPVDPAIISAQMAKPDSLTKTSQQSIVEPPKNQAAESSRPVPSGKLASGPEEKPSSNKPVTVAQSNGPEATTPNVETEVLVHFRKFANNEKLKVQERRRNQSSQDRTMKINELVKFSQNFKLKTPVPKDLVPILAKDPNKQEAIVERARRQCEENSTHQTTKPSQPAAPTLAIDTAKPLQRSGQSRADANSVSHLGPVDRQTLPRGRQGYPPTGPQASQGQNRGPGYQQNNGRGLGHLGHRLAGIQQQRKGSASGPVPPPVPLPDSRPPQNTPQTSHPPTSGHKFNVRASEFKPNPTASSFTPGAVSAISASPVSISRAQSLSRTASPLAFFGTKKPVSPSERSSIKDHFNPLKRMRKEHDQHPTKDHAAIQSIPPPYRTGPTWDAAPTHEEKTYADMFKSLAPPPISPQVRSSPSVAQIHPQPPQIPFQMPQQFPHALGPAGPHLHHHLHPQPPHAAPIAFDDHHRMQTSASSSQVFPSPRPQPSHVGFASPMPPPARIAYNGQPPFYSPTPPAVHVQPFPVAQHGMAAPMMVHQPSNGPYMAIPQGIPTPYAPQMGMYSPSPGHVYPHTQPSQQPPSGFPSPRAAPIMMHSSSQQGHPPQPAMFMNGQPTPVFVSGQPVPGPHNRAGFPQHPHFPSSPHQVHPFPHQPHRNHNNHYAHGPPMFPHMPTGPQAMSAEGLDEVK